jgi:hypothetical protein
MTVYARATVAMSKRARAKSSRAEHVRGIEAQQQKEEAFFQLADRVRVASDPEQVKQLGDQLGRFVFRE